MSVNLRRYRPFCRQERSWKMKKVAKLAFSSFEGGIAGSCPTKELAQSVPISLRDKRLCWLGSCTADVGCWDWFGEAESRSQWTIWYGNCSSATSAGDLGSKFLSDS